MAEAYECDRCGDLHAGSPDTLLTVSNGQGRSRVGTPGEDEYHPPSTEMPDFVEDLCPECRESLEEWFEGPGYEECTCGPYDGCDRCGGENGS